MLTILCTAYSLSFSAWSCTPLKDGSHCTAMGRPDDQEIKCLGSEICTRNITATCTEWSYQRGQKEER